MRLRSLNLGVDKYGYPLECGYSKATFNGHRIGMAICIKNANTGEIEKNFLRESLGNEECRNELLEELLTRNDGLVLEKEQITQFDENTSNLVFKDIYYLPYYVMDHVMHKPTIVHDNIFPCMNAHYSVEIEIVLVEEGLTRYLVLPFQTRNVSVMDLVHDFFEFDYSTDESLREVGIHYQNGSEDQEAGYTLDFYDNFGHRHDLVFGSVERIRDAIVSMRLVKFKRCIEDEEGNECT